MNTDQCNLLETSMRYNLSKLVAAFNHKNKESNTSLLDCFVSRIFRHFIGLLVVVKSLYLGNFSFQVIRKISKILMFHMLVGVSKKRPPVVIG